MAKVNVKYVDNMKRKVYSFPISLTEHTCKGNEAAKTTKRILAKFNFESLLQRSHFESKGFIKAHLHGGSVYIPQPQLEDFWKDCVDEREVRRRDWMGKSKLSICHFQFLRNVQTTTLN